MPTEELPIPTESIVEEPAPAKPVDLSSEIAAAVSKQPGDRVRVSRVWGDHYRCNWVAPRNRIDNALLDSYHIRHSRFLKVTRAEGGKLIIQDMTAVN
jgi:hypothetical protein